MPGRDFSLYPTPPEENVNSVPSARNQQEEPFLEQFDTEAVNGDTGTFVFFQRLFSVVFCCFCCSSAKEDQKVMKQLVPKPVDQIVQEPVNPTVQEPVDPAEIDRFREEWRQGRNKAATQLLTTSTRSSRKHMDSLNNLFSIIGRSDFTDRDFSSFIYIFPTDEAEVHELHQTTVRNLFRPSANIVPLTFEQAAKAFVETWDPEKRGDMEYAKSMVDKWEKASRKQMLVSLSTRPYIGFFRDDHFGGGTDNLFHPYVGQPPRKLIDKTQLVYDANEDVISALNEDIAHTKLKVIRLQMYSQMLVTQEPPIRTDKEIIAEVSESLRRRHCASTIQKVYNPSSLFIIQTFYLMVIPYRYYEITVSAAELPTHLNLLTTEEGRTAEIPTHFNLLTTEEGRRRQDNVHWQSEDRHMEVEQGYLVRSNFEKYFRKFEANVYLIYFFDEIQTNPETKENFLKEHGEYI